jgi:two-component system nitrate/nitrite response regulator NarL
MLLESWEEIQVVGDTGDEAEAVSLVQNEQPQIVLLELDFKSQPTTGLDLLSKLLSASKARIIIVTHLQGAELHHSAIQHGARGLVLKEHSPEQLRKAILKVHAGEVWLDERLTTSIITLVAMSSRHHTAGPQEGKGFAQLSPRESQLARLVGEGLSNKEIANRLFISETTVRHHLTSIFRKLDMTNRLELIIYLLRPEATSKLPAPSTSRHNSVRDLHGVPRSDQSREVSLKRTRRPTLQT